MTMDERLIKIFQSEIQRQCSFTLMSVDFINRYNQDSAGIYSTDFLWYHVQNFLISTANISKLLWGSNQKQNDRRKALRESLDVDDDSILFSRDFRNDFEHFDERLETWFKNTGGNLYVDSNVGPTSMFGDLDSSVFLRNFDNTIGSITFEGKEYKLEPIVKEIVQLNNKVSDVTADF